MSSPGQPLPEDPQLLRQMVVELQQELQGARRREQQLRHQIEVLARRLFGRRSEKLDPNQLQLVFAELDQLGLSTECGEQKGEEEDEVEPPHRPRRGAHGRQRLPEHLPRIRVEHEPSAEELNCQKCGKALARIREEISEQLEYVPASFRVLQNVRGVYARCGCEETVVTAPVAPKPIAKGLPGPGLLAHVVTSKYADHLPLNRLEGIFARQGVELSRSTLCDWIRCSAELARPVVEAMKAELLGSKVIHTDDTPVPVLDRSRESTRTGRLWVYLGDRDHPHIVFDFTADRTRAGPQGFLDDYRGYLQADAYGGYDGVYAGGKVVEVACWAHGRRKFYDARTTEMGAFTALAMITQLYQVERAAQELADLDAEKLRDFRQTHALPILQVFGRWVEEQSTIALPKSPLGEALTYARNQWAALQRYCEDGELAIDNNRAERALRRVAVGRKNWMFAGSDEGGHRAAILYSLIASCKLHGLDPFGYLRDLFDRLPRRPAEPAAELTPWAQARARDRREQALAAAA